MEICMMIISAGILRRVMRRSRNTSVREETSYFGRIRRMGRSLQCLQADLATDITALIGEWMRMKKYVN